jgi:hypothetical protein
MTKDIKKDVRSVGAETKTTKEIRTVLKTVINKELLNIETLFDGLPPKERLEIIVKLIPYVLPKVDNVSHSLGEPMDFGF